MNWMGGPCVRGRWAGRGGTSFLRLSAQPPGPLPVTGLTALCRVGTRGRALVPKFQTSNRVTRDEERGCEGTWRLVGAGCLPVSRAGPVLSDLSERPRRVRRGPSPGGVLPVPGPAQVPGLCACHPAGARHLGWSHRDRASAATRACRGRVTQMNDPLRNALPSDSAFARRAAIVSCWLCGIQLHQNQMVPDGDSGCPDIRWYCQDTRACTERWPATRRQQPAAEAAPLAGATSTRRTVRLSGGHQAGAARNGRLGSASAADVPDPGPDRRPVIELTRGIRPAGQPGSRGI
jgi:hypothetical protein